MKKALLIAAIVGFVAPAAMAQTQGLALWFDIRDDVSANQVIDTPTYPYTNGYEIGQTRWNLGKAGDGQMLWLTPDHGDAFETLYPVAWPNNDGNGNTSNGALWLYAYVADKTGSDDVISSIGVDFDVVPPASPRNTISALSFAWEPMMNSETNEGKADGTAALPDWNDARAVKVPVGAGPAYAATGGLVPQTPKYKIGKLSVTAGLRNCTRGTGHMTNSTYDLFMKVDKLLITRAFNPTGPGDTNEDPNFGYTSTGWDAAVDGCVEGSVSAAWDAKIVIQLKGDSDGNGNVLNADFQGWVDARTAGTSAKQRQIALHDFIGDNRRVLNNDFDGWVAARTTSTTCP